MYGLARTGGSLREKVDRNGDGQISMFEAHVYVLRNSDGADLPRSTSEVYLEKWEPWHFRFLPSGLLEINNLYSDSAGYVALKNGFFKHSKVDYRLISKQRYNLKNEKKLLEEEKLSLQKMIKELQKTIKKQLSMLWPELMNPYTQKYHEVVGEALEEITSFLVELEPYNKLKKIQDRDVEIDNEILKLTRKATQLDRVVWLKKLAKLKVLFDKYASDDEKKEYEQLWQCEQQPLF